MTSPTDDNPVEDLIDELLDELLELPTEDLPTALERMCAAHPEHQERLRARVRTLESLGLLGSGQDGESAGMAVPERLGPFRLLGRLGGGGMGVVYRARQDGLEREVALKVLRPEMVFFEQSRTRFRREAEAVARLTHPGIVPVYAAGEAGGVPYLAMELVDGRALDDVIGELRHRGVVGLHGVDIARAVGCDPAAFGDGWNEACARLARMVAEALAHAHERGVVHRDVKPSNVMLARDGRARVVDFGLASAEGQSRITRTGTQLGSLPYSSPEQIQGGKVDGRSDVFALGAVLHELLTLEPAFDGATASELTHRILTRDPTPARRPNPDASADLEAIALKALEKDPARRYPDAAAMAADLGAFLDYRGVTARRVEGLARLARWARREQLKAMLAAVLALGVPALAGLGGYLIASQGEIASGRDAMRRSTIDSLLGDGYLALANDEDDEAFAAFERALTLAPAEVEAQAGLDAVRARRDPTLRRPVTAEELAAAEGPVDAGTLFALAVRMVENGRRGDPEALVRALDLMQRAIDRAPAARALNLQMLAEIAGWLEDPAIADRAADALQARWPDQAMAWYASGRALLGVDPSRAVACFERALSLRPDLAHVHGNLGVALRNAGRVEGALAEFRTAADLAPDSAVAHSNLGATLLAVGDAPAARGALESAVQADPRHPGARYNLGVACAQTGDVDAAIRAFAAVVELAPDYAEAWNNLGSLRMQAGDVPAATAAFSELTARRPDFALGWKNLALAHWSAERWTEAIAALERARALAPDDEEVLQQLRTLREHTKIR